MIKLTDLLKEEETFTATSKKSGETSVFKSKDSRDAAVKSGTHSKIKDKEDSEEEEPKGDKANMFSKDAGYDAPDDDDDDDDYEIDDSDEDVVDLPQEVQDEFEDSVKDLGYSWADIGTIPGVISFMDKDENAVMVSTGAAYGGDEPFYVSGYNLPDMEDGDSDETNGKSFDTKEDAMAYAKELAQTLKGGEPKSEPLNVTDDFIDSLKSQYKNVSNQTPEQKKELETSLINKLDKEQLKKLAFSDINVVSDMASKKWYNLSYPSDDEPKKDKSEPSTSDSIDNAYDAKDFKSTVKSLKGKVSDEDYNEIKDNLKALANLQYDLGDIDRDEDNEEWGMQKDTIDVEVDDLKGLITKAIDNQVDKNGVPLKAIDKDLDNSFYDKEEIEAYLNKPTKDSTQQRAGNPKVNKVVSGKAKKLGITPQKLGKEEYEKRMTQAAVEALTDANFHSDARKLISVLEDNPDFAKDPNSDPKKPKDIFSDEYDEWRKNSVYSSTFYDSSEGTDDIAHSATGESGWDGIQSLDAIAYDLKMNGSKKLAAKLQSIFEGTSKRGFKNQSLKNLI